MATAENLSEVSEFYLACRNGDLTAVNDYIMKMSDTKWKLNQYEPIVKSTPLHAACFYGHKEIVQLLLEHRCDRSQINKYGLTAYEEAANDEIRSLFKRSTDDPDTRRFQDENMDDCFDLVKRPKETTEETFVHNIPSKTKTKKMPTIQSYQTKTEKQLEVGYSIASINMCQSKLGRFIADKFQSNKPMSLESMANELQEIIDKEITAKKDPQSQKANELLNQFRNDSQQESIHYLLRLYTLETRFYHVLRLNPMPLALPVYVGLESLKNRYFQGQSYRGAKMSDDDITTYERAAKNSDCLLQTKHFSSTSLEQSVAEQFLSDDNRTEDTDRRNSVLLIFNFPKQCEQAINLSRISPDEPCISEFENEAEVLLLPWTLFQVDKITKTSSQPLYKIYLTNILLPQKSLLSSFKWILTHPKGSIDRFHEYFPKEAGHRRNTT